MAGMFLKTSALSLRSICGPSKSCSFLIWSSLDMSANSSRKPSRLLVARRRKGNEWAVRFFAQPQALLFTSDEPSAHSSSQPLHLSFLQTTLMSHLLKPLWGEEVQQVEELLQIILQWSPCQQQLMIYLVAIEDPEKLENGARKGGKKGPSVASGWPTVSTFSCLQLPFPSGSEAPNP